MNAQIVLFLLERERFIWEAIAIVNVNKEYAKIVSDISGYHIKNITREDLRV